MSISIPVALMDRPQYFSFRHSVQALARHLAFKDGNLVDSLVVAFDQPILREDSHLCQAIIRLWREHNSVDPSQYLDRSRFGSEEVYREYLKKIPEYKHAIRERNEELMRWLDKCFPGHCVGVIGVAPPVSIVRR